MTRQRIRQSWSVLPHSDKTNAFVVGTALLVAIVLIATGIVLHLTGAEKPVDNATWPAPDLENPETIMLSSERPTLNLKADKDYRLVLPCEGLNVKGGLMIHGGRNVVLHDGTINVTDPGGARGLFLNDQTGVIDVSNIHIAGHLTEGIDLAQGKQATVQLQNVLIDQVNGTRATNHADLVQTWAGPQKLRIDGLRGTTTYQGLFLTPNQRFDGPAPDEVDLRNISIKMTDESAYALWRDYDGKQWTPKSENITVFPAKKKTRDLLLWPKPSSGDDTWNDVVVKEAGDVPDLAPTPSMRRCG